MISRSHQIGFVALGIAVSVAAYAHHSSDPHFDPVPVKIRLYADVRFS